MTGITNEKGHIYQSYRYNVFGEITFGAPKYENENPYNGESYNPNIESQYLRARYYYVTTAEFLTEDSYLGNITEPLMYDSFWDGDNVTVSRVLGEGIMDTIQMAVVAGGVKECSGGSASKSGKTGVGNGSKSDITVDDFIKRHVDPNFQQNVVDAFMDDVKVTVLEQDMKVDRYHGGGSKGVSYWYTPNQTSNPAADLALPKGNTYQKEIPTNIWIHTSFLKEQLYWRGLWPQISDNQVVGVSIMFPIHL